jgi:hypothetical protein
VPNAEVRFTTHDEGVTFHEVLSGDTATVRGLGVTLLSASGHIKSPLGISNPLWLEFLMECHYHKKPFEKDQTVVSAGVG